MNPAAVRLIACSQCDLLQKRLLTDRSVGTRCMRCHAVIEPPAHASFDRPLALVVAAAEQLSAINAEEFFAKRLARADRAEFRRLLDRDGGEPPSAEDSLDGTR